MKILMVLFLGVCLYGGTAMAQEYRKVGREKFRVIDTTGFYLYSLNKLVQGEKIARPETVYYFSVDSGSPVLELTMDNLEKAFAGNAKFRYSLEEEFHGDRQLMAYDKLLKTYKIKYLYGQTLK
ncbi:MAG: hypothetical protein J0H74_17580 [Chitinophagaceae bacterium]|nr:hypothetical protein [Chitinophagaceae bacterium]